MPDDRSDKKKVLEVNKEQAQFYEKPELRKFNPIMNLWKVLRRRMYYLMNNANIWSDTYRLQKEWLGNLHGKKVLDFGCYDGNALSTYLASNAGEYWGVDLSGAALKRLECHFLERGITGARLVSTDILSEDFTEKDFDIVYAQGVLHHFNPIEVVLKALSNKLVSGGRIVSLDPLQTSFLTKSVRAVYHPFRSDRDWEWPLRREAFSTIKNYYHIRHLQGMMGRSKWTIPLAFIAPESATRLAQRLHQQDLKSAHTEGKPLWGCLQLVMCLEKPSQ